MDAAFGNSRRLRWRFHWVSASASVHRSFPSNQALHFGDTQGYHVASSRYVSHDIMSYIVIYCDNVQIWVVKVDGIHVSDGFETVRRVLDDAKPQFQAKSWGPASGWIAMDHLRFDPWTTSARGGHGQTDIVIRYYHDKSCWPIIWTTCFSQTHFRTKFLTQSFQRPFLYTLDGPGFLPATLLVHYPWQISV